VPVFALNSRRIRGEICIPEWCTGCGCFAENCPYANINMVGDDDDSKKAHAREETTCELC
jgi:hypothetical protein